LAPAKKRELRLHSPNHIAVAGTNRIFGEEVKEGEVHVYQHISARNRTSAITRLLLEKERGGTIWTVEDTPAPAAGQWYTFHEEVYLYEGDRLSLAFVGCLLNDVLDLDGLGYVKEVD